MTVPDPKDPFLSIFGTIPSLCKMGDLSFSIYFRHTGHKDSFDIYIYQAVWAWFLLFSVKVIDILGLNIQKAV